MVSFSSLSGRNSMLSGQGGPGADTAGKLLVTWSTESLGLTGENSIIGRSVVVS